MLLVVAALVPLLSGCFGGGSKERKGALTTSSVHPVGGANEPVTVANAAPKLPAVPAGAPAPKQREGPAHWESSDHTGADAITKKAPIPAKQGTIVSGVEAPPSPAPASAFKSLDEAAAAGKLDRAVVDALQKQGSAEAIVTFAYQSIIDDAEAKAPRGKGRAKAVIEEMQPAFKSKKDDALGGQDGLTIVRKWDYLPAAFVRFGSADALLAVLNRQGVLSVSADHKLHALSSQHLNFIRQPQVQQAGYIGSGTYVGVLDTGVNYNYSDFGSCPTLGASGCKVANELEIAPQDNVLDTSTHAGVAGHGSNVAAIVTQVAPGTRILAFDVFDGESTYYQYVNSALNQLIAWKNQGYKIAAANMSLGGRAVHLGCPNSFYAATIAATRAAGILPVVATGNSAGGGSGSYGIGDPSCTPAALSVGATYDYNVGAQVYNGVSQPAFTPTCSDSTTLADRVACFSQTDEWLDMLAPGTGITGAGGTYWGTSQAAPHVAGAAAVLAAAVPSATVDQIQAALVNTGPSDTDQRYTTTIVRHRLDLAAARSYLAGGTTDTTLPIVSAPTERIDGQMTATTVPVVESWSATDASGIKAYDLLARTDNGNWIEQSLPTATTTSVSYDLAIGHNYQFGIYAQDGAGNWSDFSAGPTFTVDAQDDASSGITWTTGWSRYAWSGYAFGGYGVASSTTSATSKFTFTGRDVAFIAPFASNLGEAKIYADGTYNGTVNLYSASISPRIAAYYLRWPTAGAHSITVQVAGTAGRPRVDVDAFAVLR